MPDGLITRITSTYCSDYAKLVVSRRLREQPGALEVDPWFYTYKHGKGQVHTGKVKPGEPCPFAHGLIARSNPEELENALNWVGFLAAEGRLDPREIGPYGGTLLHMALAEGGTPAAATYLISLGVDLDYVRPYDRRESALLRLRGVELPWWAGKTGREILERSLKGILPWGESK